MGRRRKKPDDGGPARYPILVINYEAWRARLNALLKEPPVITASEFVGAEFHVNSHLRIKAALRRLTNMRRNNDI